MAAPRLRRLDVGGFQGEDPLPSWFGKLVDALNGFFTDIQKALGTTEVVWKDITVNAVSPFVTIPVTHGLKGKPAGVMVAKILDKTDPTQTPFTAINWDLSTDGSQVLLRTIFGLTAGHTYQITLKIERS